MIREFVHSTTVFLRISKVSLFKKECYFISYFLTLSRLMTQDCILGFFKFNTSSEIKDLKLRHIFTMQTRREKEIKDQKSSVFKS